VSTPMNRPAPGGWVVHVVVKEHLFEGERTFPFSPFGERNTAMDAGRRIATEGTWTPQANILDLEAPVTFYGPAQILRVTVDKA
jgi:hypothetical protein